MQTKQDTRNKRFLPKRKTLQKIRKLYNQRRKTLDVMSICFNATHVYVKGEWLDIIGFVINFVTDVHLDVVGDAIFFMLREVKPSDYHISLQQFTSSSTRKLVKRVWERVRIDRRCLLVALRFLHKAMRIIDLDEKNYIPYFCAAVMISSKMNEDLYLPNSGWSLLFQLCELQNSEMDWNSGNTDFGDRLIQTNSRRFRDLRILNRAERILLQALDYKLFENMHTIRDFVADLCIKLY